MASREELLYVIRGDNRLSGELREARGQVKNTDRSVNTLNKSLGSLKNMVGGLAIGAAFSAAARGVANSISKVREFRMETAKLTDAQGGRLDNIVTKTKAIADTYDKEYNEVLKSANVAAERFETTQVRALDLINKGFLEGGKNADDFLKQIREYSGSFKEAGFNAQQFFGTVIAGTKKGAFADKMPDAIKEGAMALREQTKPVQDALQNAFGEKTAQEFKKGIESGSLNARDAIIKLNKEIKASNPNAQEMQQLIADIFKGPGEDLGMDLIRNLDKMTQAMREQKGEMNSLTKHQKEMRAQYEQLAASQNRLARNTEQFGNVYNQIWVGIKDKTFDVLNEINKGMLAVSGQATLMDFAKDRGKGKGAESVAETFKLAKERAQEEDTKYGKGFNTAEILKHQEDILEEKLRKTIVQRKGQRERKKDITAPKGGTFEEGARNLADLAALGATTVGTMGMWQGDAGVLGSDAVEETNIKNKLGETLGKESELRKALSKIRSKRKERKRRITGKKFDFGKDDEGDGGIDTDGLEMNKAQNRADRIVSQAPDSINIEIGKLIETFNVITENLEEGTEETKEKVLQAIFTAINNGQAAGNR